MKILHHPISGVKKLWRNEKNKVYGEDINKKYHYGNHSFRDGAKNH
jgi:surface antigen